MIEEHGHMVRTKIVQNQVGVAICVKVGGRQLVDVVNKVRIVKCVVDGRPKSPVSIPQQYSDIVHVGSCNGKIQLSIEVEVGSDNGRGRYADAGLVEVDADGGLEGPIAFTEHNGDRVGAFVDYSEIGFTVAVEIADCCGDRDAAERYETRGLEASVAVASQN